MKKAAAIILWATSAAIISTISVGTAIAYEPHCHDAYNKFWKKIHEPHHLDHKPSKETIRKWTAYNKEMLHKLDIACEVMIDGSTADGLLRTGNIWSGSSISIPPATDLFPDMPLEEAAISSVGILEESEYTVYENASVSIPGDGTYGPYPGSSGWFGGGGYLGSVGSGSNLGNNPPPPPIAPTPEPLPFALGMVGAAFIVVRRRK